MQTKKENLIKLMHQTPQLYGINRTTWGIKSLKEINRQAYRKQHNTPLVELAPLPASAQFLNVIESVFSGMAKAIIHNSNYSSTKQCQLAINSYFAERNTHFLNNPQRAGKKIWGKELSWPVFNEAGIFKDSRWR